MAHRLNGDSEDAKDSVSGDDRSNSGDKPTYLLDHLFTFVVDKKLEIKYPADGMRKFLQLEKTTEISSRKVHLCFDRPWILLIDYTTGEVIERVPVSKIKDPTSFTSDSMTEIYNNILVMTVRGGSSSQSQMYIFQCQSISSVHLVNDLSQLRKGKTVTQDREFNPPPLVASPLEFSRSCCTML
ncbi:hypothetical protein HA402_014456 [Bradysia odoriphaga]|nr:hypothetical protein HA402_014456 [Bradysia odoriphaga]